MRKPSPFRRRLARAGRAQAGAAALETVCAVSLALTLGAAAGDLGRVLRGQVRLEAAAGGAVGAGPPATGAIAPRGGSWAQLQRPNSNNTVAKAAPSAP